MSQTSDKMKEKTEKVLSRYTDMWLSYERVDGWAAVIRYSRAATA